MTEQLLDTIQGIINYELPKNKQGQATVYDKPILGWFFGDSDITGAKNPSIVFQATTPTSKNVGFGTKMIEHKVNIKFNMASADVESSERNILEFCRLIYEALLPHTYMWVMQPCPICLKKIFTPEHYTIAHGALLAPYVASTTSDFNTLWANTHPNTIPAPSLAASGLAADAYLRMLDDVKNNVSVAGLTAQAQANILTNITAKRREVRMVFDVMLSDIKESDGGVGKENMHAGEFTLSAKELIRQFSYGPDNVPTGAYALNTK